MADTSSFLTAAKKAVSKNFSEQTEFLLELIQTNSANPFTPEASDPEAPIEKELAEVIYKKLKGFGFSPRYLSASKARPNVVATMGPARARKSMILNGHMDTKPAPKAFKGDPLEGYSRSGKVYGLGAYDMKASLSAMVFAGKAIADLQTTLRGKLHLTFVADEQPGACSKLGTHYLLRQGVKAKAAIVTEPGEVLGIGHRGGYRFKLETKGEMIHTGLEAWQKRKKGKNAIKDMATVIEALDDFDLAYKNAKAFPGKKPVLTFPTLIEGGSAINMVPDQCIGYGDVRLMPGNSDKQVRLWIEEALKELDLDYSIQDLLYVPAVEVDAREEVVESVVESFRQLGNSIKMAGIGPWNDGWMFMKKDIPTIVQVPLKGGWSKQRQEWVELKSLEELTLGLVLSSVSYLGKRTTH